MTTRIGLISDVHACPAPVQEAMDIFRREQVSLILCAGDIAGYGAELAETVELLKVSECTAILGNHDSWYMEREPEEQVGRIRDYFRALPCIWEACIDGVRIYAAHASPPQSLSRGIRLLDEHGNIIPEEKRRWAKELERFRFDILIVGHTHQVFAERLGDMLVINPGSTKFNHSCVVLCLPEKEVKIMPLSGKEIQKTWNWGMVARGWP